MANTCFFRIELKDTADRYTKLFKQVAEKGMSFLDLHLVEPEDCSFEEVEDSKRFHLNGISLEDGNLILIGESAWTAPTSFFTSLCEFFPHIIAALHAEESMNDLYIYGKYVKRKFFFDKKEYLEGGLLYGTKTFLEELLGDTDTLEQLKEDGVDVFKNPIFNPLSEKDKELLQEAIKNV